MKHAACQTILGIDSQNRSDKPPPAVLIRASNNHGHSPREQVGLDEQERTQLITTIVSLIQFDEIPPNVYQAALTLVGWLARRQLSEHPCNAGVAEAMTQSIIAAEPSKTA